MMSKKKKISAFWLLVAILVVIATMITFWLRKYYNDRYVLDDYYYTAIPYDYDITPKEIYSSQGDLVDYEKEYELVCYNDKGEEKILSFRAMMRFQELYPGGTYVQVAASKVNVLYQKALPVSEVPAVALGKIQSAFLTWQDLSLTDYAQERTKQLMAINTETAFVTCTVEDTTLVYRYVFNTEDKDLSQKQAKLLDFVYRAQFRTDSDTNQEITAIILEVLLTDGTEIYTQEYKERITFGYDKKS